MALPVAAVANVAARKIAKSLGKKSPEIIAAAEKYLRDKGVLGDLSTSLSNGGGNATVALDGIRRNMDPVEYGKVIGMLTADETAYIQRLSADAENREYDALDKGSIKVSTGDAVIDNAIAERYIKFGMDALNVTAATLMELILVFNTISKADLKRVQASQAERGSAVIQ